jgi:hypothetical protein
LIRLIGVEVLEGRLDVPDLTPGSRRVTLRRPPREFAAGHLGLRHDPLSFQLSELFLDLVDGVGGFLLGRFGAFQPGPRLRLGGPGAGQPAFEFAAPFRTFLPGFLGRAAFALLQRRGSG